MQSSRVLLVFGIMKVASPPFVLHLTMQGEKFLPPPSPGEGLLSEPGQLSLPPALLNGAWAGSPHVSLLQGGGLGQYVKGNVLVLPPTVSF